jgi:hypothetical protein
MVAVAQLCTHIAKQMQVESFSMALRRQAGRHTGRQAGRQALTLVLDPVAVSVWFERG